MRLCFLMSLLATQDPIEDLQHMDEHVRLAAIYVIGGKKMEAGILPLIELIRYEPKGDIRNAAVDALRKLTDQTFGDSYAEWRQWWDREGMERFARTITSSEVDKLLQPHKTELQRATQRAEEKINKLNWEVRWLSGITVAVAVFFLLIMFYFVAHVSARVKTWKELVNRAEVYLEKGEEMVKRTDQITAELDAKKADIMTFVSKVRDDTEGEVERYSDVLQKNLEHTMRENMMALRQKAEKELQQTLGELRAQVDMDIRRAASEQKEKSEKALLEQREKFLKEVEAHTLFIEASFLSIHGKHDEALRRYRKLVQLKPDHLLAWNNLGVIYRDLARYPESLDALEKALELSPNNSSVLYNIAATYARMRKRDKMLDALKRAIANDGEYKDEALNDTSFREYWNDLAFKDVAEG